MAEKFVSNIIRMTNLIDCSNCLSRSTSLWLISFICCFAVLSVRGNSQSLPINNAYESRFSGIGFSDTTKTVDPDNFPKPGNVLLKSLIVPGWGQITNRQSWKVPIVYGLLGGLTYYSIYLTKQYHDYRAAYYNLNEQTPDDFKYGPTPGHLSDVQSLESLKSNRNTLRNRRDQSYLYIGLAYGLNIIDAYVFAHMRTFDVSEDLSVGASVSPGTSSGNPGVTLSINLYKKK